MKILLDECMPVDFRHAFPGHEVHTVQWAGFKGKRNGELLLAADAAGYDVLLTVDHGIPQQQNLNKIRRISLLVIRSSTNQLEDLAPFVDGIERALANLQPGKSLSILEP